MPIDCESLVNWVIELFPIGEYLSIIVQSVVWSIWLIERSMLCQECESATKSLIV
jgi:hypothetical protein